MALILFLNFELIFEKKNYLHLQKKNVAEAVVDINELVSLWAGSSKIYGNFHSGVLKVNNLVIVIVRC